MNQQVRIKATDLFKARFTAPEFLRMAEAGAFDDMKVELIDGQLERMNPPQYNHAGRQARLVVRLARLVPEALLCGEVGIAMGGDTIMGCDVAVLRSAIDGNRLLTPDDLLLVVEVAETTVSRDLGMKRAAYAQAGIPHYSVVDGTRSVVHVFAKPMDGEFSAHATVGFGEPLAVPGTGAAITLD